jgi:hypothetical protein
MLLASQVVGALAGGLLVFFLARAGGLTGRRATAAIAVVAIAVASLLSLPNLRVAIAQFLDQREVNSVLSSEQARLAPGTAAGVDVEFVTWVEDQLEPGESFRLAISHPEEDQAQLHLQWIYFQLASNLAVDRPTEADWIVFYEVPPARYRAPIYRDVEVYEPGYAIARFAGAR